MRAEFANADRKWLPGQFLKVRILAGEQTAMLVPQSAVLPGEQSRSVMVIGAEGKAVPKPVQVAGWYGRDTIITSGLAEGDIVIVDGLVKVRPGTVVQAKAAAPQPAPAPSAAGK
jgi:membrane fusion protein (multidrug efflux system)